MKVKQSMILVHLHVNTAVPKLVFPWEIDVLQEKFEGKIEVGETVITEVDELPSAEGEFARLHRVYGTHDETNVPHADNAYGRGKAGVLELGKVIAKSVVKPRKSKAVKPAKKAKSDKPKSETRDPLE